MSTEGSRAGNGARDRRAKRLQSGLEKSLSAYAAAATAAGVSWLALASSAEAKIVYTPANTNIPPNGGPVFLDLNHDGTPDFSFSYSRWYIGSERTMPILKAAGENQGNQVWGRGSFSFYRKWTFASALHPGFKVRSNKSYFRSGKPWLMFYGDFSASRNTTWGQWSPDAEHRYLGLKFMVGGQAHYGWARFNTALNPPPTGGTAVTLTGYAYETVPNKSIITGKTKGPDVVVFEPASLGRLAQGASAIPAWRAKPVPTAGQ